MRGDDEVPQVGEEGAECTGTCLSKVRSELKDATPDEILHEVQAFCESQSLADFCKRHGVNDTTFNWNPRLQCRRGLFRRRHSHGKLYQQFWKAYQEQPSLNLALVFHGTANANVHKILRYGLDPQYRRTQAFGRGEYFSKEPGLSATYGECLLVFLILMPEDHEKLYSNKDRDIIVVPDLSHQLPLGMLQFESVSQDKIQHSQQMRLEQRHLKEAAMECDWQVSQAKLTKEMAVLLKYDQIHQASTVLRESTKYHTLSNQVKQELAALAKDWIPNEETRKDLFPALQAVDPAHTCIESIPALQAQAEEAWDAFLAMKMDPNRNILAAEHAAPVKPCTLQAQKMGPQLPGIRVVMDNNCSRPTVWSKSK